MPPRRQVRPPLLGVCLNLGGGTSGEVQVQQKNEQEVNKFFIDVDDSMVSPLVTTVAGGGVCGLGSFPSSSPAARPGGAMLANGVGGAKHTGSVGKAAIAHAGAGGSTIMTGPATFIHVNNTNLFVLIDGISMFLEGKSTFTGDNDPFIQQHILKKKSAKEASKRKTNFFLDHTQGVSKGTVDTVEEAIRDIVQNASRLSSPRCLMGMSPTESQPPPAMPPPHGSCASCKQPFYSLPKGSSGGVPSAASTRSMPSQFLDLFTDATKPQGLPLFRRRIATTTSLGWCACEKQPSARANNCIASPPSESKKLQSSMPPRCETLASFVTDTRPVIGGSARNHLCTDGSSLASSFCASNAIEIPNARLGGGSWDASPVVSWQRTSLSRGGRQKPFSVADLGCSNCSLDLDEVEILYYIGGGSQGKVYCVRLNDKLYALKCMDVKEAIESTNAMERQGRKRGLVKELNMIRLQRYKSPPKYLMHMFNAVASLDNDRQQLSILIELMSFAVEDMQKMVARLPQNELMKIAQSTFRAHMAKNNQQQMDLGRGLKEQYGPSSRVIGRSFFDMPKDWEMEVERQTAVPEIALALIAADVLRGLKELHFDYRIVHCDIKPANVLLSFDKQRFKLADFGCGSAMGAKMHGVHLVGVDMGSRLYRPPERLVGKHLARSEGEAALEWEDRGSGGETCESARMEFTGKADVWSLGVMLLELACGVHPCNPFKSDFWNYASQLKLANMVKPLTWSSVFCDFIIRSVCVDVVKRWSVDELLQHPFVLHYDNVPRNKLKIFMERLAKDSENFQRRQQRELLQKQILLSTNQVARDNYQRESRSKWRGFTGFLSAAPELKDLNKFPQLT